MVRIKQFMKRTKFILAAVLILTGYPATTSADTTPTSSPQTGSTQSTGPQSPTGPAANTYTYNPATGLWENAYYTWNPVTQQTTPKTGQDYSYNPATGKWDTNDYKYDPTTGAYVPNVPTPSTAAPDTSSAPTGDSNTGPGSNNNTNTSATGNSTFNNFYNAAISNKIATQAATGDAGVINNTTGGNANTGNATAIATAINLLQSSASFANAGGVTVFTSDVNNNINDNLVLDPSLLTALQPASNSGVLPTNLTINNQSSGIINNDITVGSTTGDATVAGNTNAGNATSGNANSVANLINALDSTVIAPQTFIGTINIYGNLNGNILLPGDVLQNMISNNAAPSTASAVAGTGNDLSVANSSAQAITNNVVTNAVTGAAAVAGNTGAGSATSGTASTNLTLLNLTGHQLIGADSILVFVNVLGTWVGMIMDAPTGATAAAIGGGVSSDATTPTNTTVTNNSAQTINNNVNVSAASGNATVTDNSTAGNATSGKASASANILNLTNDSLALTNWFGILFINVFGGWTGSFCANASECTDPVAVGQTNESPATSQSGDTSNTSTTTVSANITPSTTSSGFALGSQNDNGAVAGATTNQNDNGSTAGSGKVLGASTKPQTATVANHKNWRIMEIGLGMSFCLLMLERLLALRANLRNKKAAAVTATV